MSTLVEQEPTRVELCNGHVLFFYTYLSPRPHALWWIETPNERKFLAIPGRLAVDLDEVGDAVSQVLDAVKIHLHAHATELRTRADALDEIIDVPRGTS